MSARFEIPAPAWHRRAACLGVADPEIFFPEKATGKRAEAMKYCLACPVRANCEADATAFGIWGGKTPSTRRLERKRRRRVDDAAAA